MSVGEKKNDRIALSLCKGELHCPAGMFVIQMRFNYLSQCGRPCTFRSISLSGSSVESGNGFNQPRLTLSRFDKSFSLFANCGLV